MAVRKTSDMGVSIRMLLMWAVVGALPMADAQGPRVYRDRVDPHWFNGATCFWYRVELPGGGREFVLVDATRGVRRPAFSHEHVADALTKLLKRPVTAAQLPIERLEPIETAAAIGGGQAADEPMTTVMLIGRDGRFLLNTVTGDVSRQDNATAPEQTRLFLPPRASGQSREETRLVVENQWNERVQLIWMDMQGQERWYENIEAGRMHDQHTFVKHVWMIRRADGTAVACVEAQSGETRVVLNDTALAGITRDVPEERRRPRSTRSADVSQRSPNGQFEAVVREHNLWLQELSGEKHAAALTMDASAAQSFQRDASRARMVELDYDRPDYPAGTADVRWSPDSRYVLAFQTTRVDERRVHYVESSPADQLQPKLQSYPYLKPGDPLPVQRPRLFRLTDRQEIEVSSALFPDPWSLEFLKWSDDGRRFWMRYNERGHQNLRVLEVVAETGAVRSVFEDHSETFIHYSSDGKCELRWLRDGHLLCTSERSGWNHLYRVDTSEGRVSHAVTTGDWNVRRIEHLDEDAGQIWFFAVGVRAGQDPYHQHLCRAALDGTGFLILTEGDGTHAVEWSPDRSLFIDRCSRVDLPPVTELRRSSDGSLVCRLEEADASEILRDRGGFPERFVAKGRDGLTDIWGIIHWPLHRDSGSPCPVIENIYAGPHDHHVPKAFQSRYRCQPLVDQGFIVVQIDGMGTAWRSKAFHDVCWRNLKDAGFPDRIAWLRAAAAQYPELDVNRVGIYGGSAGGQNAMAALLWHNDFYKAAVADCGCHDNRMDKIWWNEQWMGVPGDDHYRASSNLEHAGLVQGRLMLVVGELDRNVDPATTMQVARKLIEADRDFDLVVVPGAGHGACETPWGTRRRTQFFVQALQPSAGSGGSRPQRE